MFSLLYRYPFVWIVTNQVESWMTPSPPRWRHFIIGNDDHPGHTLQPWISWKENWIIENASEEDNKLSKYEIQNLKPSKKI